MVGVETLESEIEPLAKRHGLSLYDVEVVPYGRATLRVYAERLTDPAAGAQAPGGKGVTIGELESFAKVLIPFLAMKDLFPREGQIEVSSPGMNRRLRRRDHFEAAIGQQVSVTFRTESGKKTVKARLSAVTDAGLTIDSGEQPHVAFENILRAQLEPEIRV